MTVRVLIASVASAIVMFVWGFLYWGVFNMGAKAFEPIPLATESSEEISKMLPRSGMYIYPFPPKMSDKQGQMNFKNSHEKGPRLRLSIKKEGAPPMPPSTFAKGLGLNFVIALLASILTAMASSSLPQFDRRFLFVSLISLLASLWVNVGDVIWWFHSPAYCMVNIGYSLVAGILMAMVIGSLVTAPSEPSEE